MDSTAASKLTSLAELAIVITETMPVRDVATEPRLAVPADSDEKIAAQLDRILASNAFCRKDRLKRFLAFIVNESMAGRGTELKETVIALEVFDKGPEFDPGRDTTVRGQARRLRSQLACYYREQGQTDELVITLPKGRYVPTFSFSRGMVRQQASGSTLARPRTILLIPFLDQSAAGNQRYFCDGLNHEIIHNLTGLESIKVVASSLPKNDNEWNLREVTANANADMIVTGSVRDEGSQLRIIVDLVDAISELYMWSIAFDRKMENILSVQQEIAREVALEQSGEKLGG